MKRHELEHILRSASQIADDAEVLVIGSQSLIGSIDDELLPPAATASMEADVAFFDDLQNKKSDLVDGAIGEMSLFHETYGYYAQGVSVSTAVLPDGWKSRLITLENSSTHPGRGLLLEPHDCVLAKLAAGREKDLRFATELIQAGIIDVNILQQRIGQMPVTDMLQRRIANWISAVPQAPKHNT
jgi:hypothetical protein